MSEKFLFNGEEVTLEELLNKDYIGGYECTKEQCEEVLRIAKELIKEEGIKGWDEMQKKVNEVAKVYAVEHGLKKWKREVLEKTDEQLEKEEFEKALGINKDSKFTEFYEKFYEKFHWSRLITEEEFKVQLDELIASDEEYKLEFIKRDMYWGIFDSTITNGLPKEFVELFEYGCKSDNVEVWYKLLYLETFHTGLKVEEILRLIKECVELA